METIGFIGLGMAMARGMGDLDHTAVARLIEEWAGIELRSKPGDPK